MRFLDALRPLGLLLLRLGLAIVFVSHGYPKLFRDAQKYADMFTQMGFPFGTSYAIGILELVGGLLVAVGLFTRPCALLLAIEMGVAVWRVHLTKSYLAVNEYEFPLMLCVAAFALATCGPGGISLDGLLLPSKALRGGGGGKGKPDQK